MPLTRHLYELDEVKSALHTCLRLHDDTGLFWLWELIVSQEEKLAADILGAPVGAECWADRYAELASLLSRCQKPTRRIYTEDSLGFDDACRRKNAVAAVWYLKSLPADTIWNLLPGEDPAPDEKGFLYQVAAVRRICYSALQKPKARDRASDKQKEQWAHWNTLIGRRKARQYAIPETALDATTTRGQMLVKYTNIGDVREPVPLLAEGCKFWQEALRTAGLTIDGEENTVCFPDDDTLEKFYEKFFPDDIPDEWSAEDQQKSHGRGRLTA